MFDIINTALVSRKHLSDNISIQLCMYLERKKEGLRIIIKMWKKEK